MSETKTEQRASFDGRRKYLTIPEVADHLNVGKTTIYKLIRSGKLRTAKIEGATRIHVHALHRYERELEADG